MAEHGARVLVLESETQFSDRVRGEAMVSWGVTEARALGVYDAIVASGGHELRYWHSATRGRCDLITTTAPGTPVAAFYHPSMQEFLIDAAAQAGAEVRRGVRVRGIEAGDTPKIVTWADGHRTELGLWAG